jgi:hypothetical protein
VDADANADIDVLRAVAVDKNGVDGAVSLGLLGVSELYSL